MILEFFRFELRQQLRSPLLWLLAVLFALLGFGAAASDAVQIGGGIGNVYRNAPSVVATWLALFTLLGMLIITIFISGALLRDFEQGTSELFFASPIRKRDYLAGRLGAALLASFVVYVVIALGIFIAQFMVYRTDRYGRGGDQTEFLAQGFPAVRVTESHEDYTHQHQDIRNENGVQYGDTIEHVDFDYLANVTRLDAITMRGL